MEEGELLIKELRIDDEKLLTEEYNPLIQVFKNKKSSTSYRNTYHRVEKVMENIINLSYKGFSDSVLSYMEVYNLNSRNIFLLSETCSLLKIISSYKFDVTDVKEIYGTTKYLSVKNEMVELLNEINKLMGEYSEISDLHYKSNILIRIKDLIKNNKLYQVDGINILRNDILLEIDHLMNTVYEKIFEYIKFDKIENKEYLRIVRVMDKYEDLDEYLFSNLKSFNNNILDNTNDNNNILDNTNNNNNVLDNTNDNNNILDNVRSINEYFRNELRIYKLLNKIKRVDHHFEDNTDLNILLIFNDNKFKKIDHSDDTLYFYKHIKSINEKNIKIIYKKIQELFTDKDINYNLINTLIKINKKVKYKLIDDLIKKYTRYLEKEIIEEVIYLFDIFCREGNFKNEYYINKILNLIEKHIKFIEINRNMISKIIKEINKYLKKENIHNEDFNLKINLLDEVLGEYSDDCIINSD